MRKYFYNLFKFFLQSSHPLLLILRAKTALNVAICMIFFNIFLDNGVMNTPKRRILSLAFTVLLLLLLPLLLLLLLLLLSLSLLILLLLLLKIYTAIVGTVTDSFMGSG